MANPELENYVPQNPVSSAEDAFRVERAACDRYAKRVIELEAQLLRVIQDRDELTYQLFHVTAELNSMKHDHTQEDMDRNLMD